MTAATLNLPRFNGWMLPDDALDIIADLIRERKPSLIVEVGSGRSTVVLADVLRDIDTGTIVSLEHQRDFALATRDWLVENSLDELAKVRHAPIVDGWYDLNALEGVDRVDMVIVDGPPGHLSPLAREPALRLLADRLTPGATVILDDTHRPEEKTILSMWRSLGFAPTTVRHSTGALSWGIVP